MDKTVDILYKKSVELLCSLISTPSFSREEDMSADILYNFLSNHGVEVHRKGNNIWAYNTHYDAAKPTILLNSHHDTVKPNAAYTRDPFSATIEGDYLYGLGSNDAGASAVSLLALFLLFKDNKRLKRNLCIAITAEEEVTGIGGVSSIIEELGDIELAIVGEPTNMNMAICERGLMVLDCIATGVSGHAARDEGDNAIYKAMRDIEWFSSFKFPKVSELFGEQKMNVTMIEAGSQHNVIPATCKYVVDIRLTDKYTHQEALDIIKEHVTSQVTPRSFRICPSSIDVTHPIVQRGLELGLTTFGSPTTSDQAVIPFTSIKIGVGESARSHSADEYVLLSEIREGIETYIKLISPLIIAE